MSDYMKEAERLIAAHESAIRQHDRGAEWDEGPAKTLSALLAHIQRGAVPSADQLWNNDEVMALNAELGLTMNQIERLVRAAMLTAAPAPDHFRDAAKMMAAPAEMPMPEPVGWYVSGSDPEHAALWRKCPDDEQMQVMNQQCDDGPVVARSLVLGADAKRYGDAREAAGYARGLKEAGRDAERYRWLTQHAYIGECFTDGGVVFEVHNTDRQVPIDGDVDAAIDAALRGEVKP